MSVTNILIHSYDTPQNQEENSSSSSGVNPGNQASAHYNKRFSMPVNPAIFISPISHAHQNPFMSSQELPTVHKHGLHTNEKRNKSGETSVSSQSRRNVYGSTHSIFGTNSENFQRKSFQSSSILGTSYFWNPNTTRYSKEVIQKLCDI